MGRWSRFLRLAPGDQLLIVEAAILMGAIRAGLRLLPFERLRRLLARLARTTRPRPPGSSQADRVLRAVAVVGRQWPVIGTCLTQALAGQVLLARHGHPVDLRIGVTRDRAGGFVAHAWLERDGVVLIGGPEHIRYTPMPALNGLEP